jgi:hypothetical protein
VYRLYQEAGSSGWSAAVTNVVLDVGKRQPRRFAEFAREFRGDFLG